MINPDNKKHLLQFSSCLFINLDEVDYLNQRNKIFRPKDPVEENFFHFHAAQSGNTNTKWYPAFYLLSVLSLNDRVQANLPNKQTLTAVLENQRFQSRKTENETETPPFRNRTNGVNWTWNQRWTWNKTVGHGIPPSPNRPRTRKVGTRQSRKRHKAVSYASSKVVIWSVKYYSAFMTMVMVCVVGGEYKRRGTKKSPLQGKEKGEGIRNIANS